MLAIQFAIFQPGMLLIHQTNAETCLLGQDLTCDMGGCRDVDFIGDFGMFAIEFKQRIVKRRKHHMTCQPQMQMPAKLIATVRHHIGKSANRPANLAAFVIKRQSLFGDLKPAAFPVNQARADLIFKPFKRIADTGLAQKQPVGRPCDRPFFDNHRKGMQQVPVELPF